MMPAGARERSPFSNVYFFFPPMVKFSLFFFCTCRKGGVLSDRHGNGRRQSANLVHGVVDLLQLFVTISGLSERLHHRLLNLGKELERTRTRTHTQFPSEEPC